MSLHRLDSLPLEKIKPGLMICEFDNINKIYILI